MIIFASRSATSELWVGASSVVPLEGIGSVWHMLASRLRGRLVLQDKLVHELQHFAVSNALQKQSEAFFGLLKPALRTSYS